MVKKIIIKTKDRRPKTEDQKLLRKKYFSFKAFFLWSFIFGLIFCSSCAKSLYESKFVAAGTYLEIKSPYKEAGSIVYAEFKRLEKIFNFYDPGSELSRLNGKSGVPVKVSAELLEVLRLAKQVNEMTNGAFDVSYGRLYEYWKERIKKGGLEFPQESEIAALKEVGGMNNIEINEAEGTVLIKKKGLKIDLGAIADGYMVDKAVMKLKKKGIDSALINVGGDIYCLGTNRGKPWRIGIKNPEEIQNVMQSEQLFDEAIATSGNYEQYFDYKGKRYSHLISPRTGFPVSDTMVSVSVITKNCTSADSLSTAFFVMGLAEIRSFIAAGPSTMRIFVITQDEEGRHMHILK
ncbi:MAG: FAD:protein FMN transferase [Candidatus Omnitrophica bacterium]|nr:FAD:protein FMN transferase [Candidatus Omnitrophota bacterium]